MDVSVINVTPKRAGELLELRWERQRKIRPGHVAFLATEMNRGRFEPSIIELVMVSETNSQVLIDGQHALNAIQSCGKSQTMILQERIVKTEDQIPYLFSRIDVQHRRNMGDSLRAFGMAERVSYQKNYLARTVASINLIKREFDMKGRREAAHEDSIKDLLEWDIFARAYFDIHESTPGEQREKQRFLIRSVLAVGLVLFRYVEEREMVNEFWQGYIHGTNLSERDPRLIGRKKMLSIDIRENPTVWHTNQVARLVAWAWNKHYEGASTQKVSIRNLNKKAPLVLNGTKYYTGRQV